MSDKKLKQAQEILRQRIAEHRETPFSQLTAAEQAARHKAWRIVHAPKREDGGLKTACG